MLEQFRAWLSRFLTRSGQKIGIDAHYFFKNSAVVSSGHFISVLHGIVVGYLITLLFPQEMYGEYRFALSVIGAISVFKLAGVPSSIAVSVTKDSEPPLWFTARWYARIAAIGSLLLICAIPLLSNWDREGLWPIFVVAAIFFIPEATGTTLFGGIVKGKALFPLALQRTVLVKTLVIIGALFTFLLYPSPAMLLACTLGIPGIVYMGSALKLLKQYSAKTKSWHVLRYGLDLSVATIPVTVAWHLDSLVISALFGLNQLATFAVAMLIPEQVKKFAKELMPVSFSRQAAGEDSWERRKKLQKIVAMLTVIFAVGIACYIFITPWIIPVLFPFYPADQVILLTNVAAATLIVIPSTLFPQYLEARGMLRPLRRSHWFSAVVFAVALLILTPKYGLLGAVVSRGIFRFSFAGYSWMALMRAPIQTGDIRT